MASPQKTRPRPQQHIRKFDGGRRTVQEYHSQFAFPAHAKCSGGCGRRPVARAVLMAPFDEVTKRGLLPPQAVLGGSVLQLLVPLKNTTGTVTPHVRLSMAYSCSQCMPAFEKELARAPSWVVVDLHRGPDPTNRVTVGARTHG